MLTEEERKERHREASRKWRAANPEKRNESFRKWHAANREKWNESVRKWHAANREKWNESCRKWRAANPEKIKESVRKWKAAHPEKIKEMYKRHSHKRQRELGFIQLNSYFSGSHAHHVDTEKVIYIPKYIHTQHRHNHNKPETMKEINKIAFNYLFGISQTVKFC